MTVLEMHTAVQLGLDKSSSLQLAAFEPEEIDYWLNEAQLELIKRKAFGNNYRQEDLNGSVKRMEDLTSLLVGSNVNTFTNHIAYSNVTTYNTSALSINPYMFYIDTMVTFSDGKKSVATLVSPTDIKNLIETTYNKPFLRVPYVFLSGSVINIIKDPYAPTISSIHLRYIKRPKTLVRVGETQTTTATSELPVQVHSELVALTVLLMLENIEAGNRLQTNQLMFNNKE